MFKRCDSTEPGFCCTGWAPPSCRAGAPPKEPKPPYELFFSALPDSALLPCDHAEPDLCGAGAALSCERCDHDDPDRCGGGALSCERCDHDDPERCGGGGGVADERLPNEPNDELFDDVDRLLLVGLDFWEENPLLNELELELDRELELEDGFAAAVTVVAAGSSRASSNII
ncbi:hypothetical protein INH39_09505 [Massilia violaceinigra]|uniref:TNFR-Cys domain-containing protein n=1 Tax=Massilia violaceinigra TaxID=2045208 RepID=A0ABY4AAP0_9BURK|nr:hypothetical protein [Massilia violaceinigra]UOD31878.1 hypothetical protein INH39_09505 [Massilia violaceinigra]